jgi:hypothetical protein
MYCRVAQDLLDDYITAAKRHGDAAIDLLKLVGTEEFTDGKARVEHSRALARAALLALEKHRKEHNCRSSAWSRRNHEGVLFRV